jgi:hypothetical protein
VRADYLAATSLDTGRPKEFACRLALLENGSTTTGEIEELAVKHGLEAALKRFRRRFLDE